MIILEDLPLEERKRLLNRSNSKLKYSSAPHIYRSVYSNIYKLRNDELSYVTVENIIKVILVKEYSDSYELDIEILNTKKHQGLEFLPKEYTEIIEKISRLKDHFVCRVNKLGLVTTILNKEDLKEKWATLKKELEENQQLINTFTKEGVSSLIEAGDRQYIADVDSLIAEINKNMVYLSIFLGFTDKSRIKERDFFSYIFPEYPMKATLNIEKEQEDANTLTYSMALQKIKVKESDIKKRFLKDFSFMQESYQEHFFDFICLNTINKESNWTENIKLTIDERINQAVKVSIICEVQKIENYE